MRLYLIRHAEAAAHENDSVRELTELGWAQAQLTADWLCQQISGSVQLVASPLLRAQQTASVIQQVFGLQHVETHDELAPDGDILRAEHVLSMAMREGCDELIVVSHMPLIASLCQWLSDGVLSTGEGFGLAEVRVLEAQVVAPGIASVVARYIPPESNNALQDLRAMLSRFSE